MNTTFDYGNEQLANAAQELTLLKVVAENTEDSLAAHAAEVLEELQLEQYLELCEIVNQDPNLIRFYARALERTEMLRVITQREELSDSRGAAKIALGSLAAKTAMDKVNYEAFFTLYAPNEPAFLNYEARNTENSTLSADIIEIPINTPEESKNEETEPAVEQIAADQHVEDSILLDDPAETEDDDATEEIHPDQQNQEEAIIVEQCLIISINGEVAQLSDIESFVLRQAIDSKQAGITKLRNSLFIDTEEYISLTNIAAGKKMTRNGYSQRFKKVLTKLNEAYPDIFIHNGAAKGGARFWLNESYDIQVSTEEESTKTAQPIQPTAPAKAQQTPQSEKSKPRKSRPKKAKAERGSSRDYIPMTSRDKLLENGVMISGRITPYTDAERVIIDILTNAERKRPISLGELNDRLNNFGPVDQGDVEIKSLMVGLQSKLPAGWLICVPTGKNAADGWRFNKGIRVSRQR